MLTASALTASAEATHRRLGGPGRWLLALPAYHVAGLQVLVRSVVAGTTPVAVSAGFDVAELASAVASLGPGRRYASLVAAQLDKASAGSGGRSGARIAGRGADRRRADAARGRRKSFGGEDFGGADVRDERDGGRLRVRRRSAGRGAGARSTSTAGWCSAARRWRRVTATRCEPDPFAEPGWFRTDDIGAVDDSGVLRVLGRVDDAISTGGLTVLPQLVEAALAPASSGRGLRGVRRRRRTAGPAGGRGDRGGDGVCGTHAGRAARPRRFNVAVDCRAARGSIVDELPRRGIGKVDRRELAARFG